VFAFPSTREGFGLAAMEALAAGVPVVTRDLPVLREVFGSAARYGTEPATLAREMRESMTERDPRRRARGRWLAAAHTWHAAVRAHPALYQALRGPTPDAHRAGLGALDVGKIAGRLDP
jgi:glycosyltransferase involved in cell wall biosynthesis